MKIKNSKTTASLMLLIGLIISFNVNSETLTVKNLNDTNIGSLRDIISIAEDGDTILFYIENESSPVINISKQLIINKNIYLNGINLFNGDTLTIKQNQDQERILSIEGAYKKVIIDNCKLMNGKLGAVVLNSTNSLTLNNCHLHSNQYNNSDHPYKYGGIFAKNKTSLYLNNCIISNNWGYDACGIYGYNANVYIKNSTLTKNYSNSTSPSIYIYGGELFIDNSLITNNTLGIIVIYGNVTMNNSIISGSRHTGNANGGAICAYAGTNVKVTDSKIQNNYSGTGAGISAMNNLTLKRTTISNNRSSTDGGGVYFSGNILQVDSCIIENNTSFHEGAGLCLWSGNDIIISNTIINNNKISNTSYGGGIYANAPFTLINSTISNNTAYYGAGLLATSVRHHISIINNTFYNNIAQTTGGAIHIGFIYGTLENFTNYVPTYPSIELINNTIAKNFALEGGGIYFKPYVSQGYGTIKLHNNIIANNNNDDFKRAYNTRDITYFVGSRNICQLNGDPRDVSAEFIPNDKESDIFDTGIPSLADNGGFTNTIKISENSLAKWTGVTNTVDPKIPITDQRGILRNNPPCIGSYEYNGFLKNSEIVQTDKLNISIKNQTILINDCITPVHLKIIDLSGKIIHDRLISGVTSLHINKGNYILIFNIKAYKIIVD